MDPIKTKIKLKAPIGLKKFRIKDSNPTKKRPLKKTKSISL